MYIKIQTNRAKLKEILSAFQINFQKTEVFIAPRPQMKKRFKYYVGYASIIKGSSNELLLIKLKNHHFISQSEFENEVQSIQYYWISGDDSFLKIK